MYSSYFVVISEHCTTEPCSFLSSSASTALATCSPSTCHPTVIARKSLTQPSPSQSSQPSHSLAATPDHRRRICTYTSHRALQRRISPSSANTFGIISIKLTLVHSVVDVHCSVYDLHDAERRRTRTHKEVIKAYTITQMDSFALQLGFEFLQVSFDGRVCAALSQNIPHSHSSPNRHMIDPLSSSSLHKDLQRTVSNSIHHQRYVLESCAGILLEPLAFRRHVDHVVGHLTHDGCKRMFGYVH